MKRSRECDVPDGHLPPLQRLRCARSGCTRCAARPGIDAAHYAAADVRAADMPDIDARLEGVMVDYQLPEELCQHLYTEKNVRTTEDVANLFGEQPARAGCEAIVGSVYPDLGKEVQFRTADAVFQQRMRDKLLAFYNYAVYRVQAQRATHNCRTA